MKESAYSLKHNWPRLVRKVLFLLMIVEIGLAFANVLPVEHEGHLRWPLMLTILAWVGMAWFTGMVAQAYEEWEKVNPLLGIALQLFLIWISLYLGILWFLDRPAGLEAELLFFYAVAGTILGGPMMIFAMVLLITMTGTGALSARAIAAKVLKSLGIAAVIVAAIAIPVAYFVIFHEYGGEIVGAVVIVMPFLGMLAMIVLMTVWFGKLDLLGQKVIASLIRLLVTFIIVGWIWYAAMDDGLRAFTGEERAAARKALNGVSCRGSRIVPVVPASGQIVSTSGGGFQVSGYTWWGLPSRCR